MDSNSTATPATVSTSPDIASVHVDLTDTFGVVFWGKLIITLEM